MGNPNPGAAGVVLVWGRVLADCSALGLPQACRGSWTTSSCPTLSCRMNWTIPRTETLPTNTWSSRCPRGLQCFLIRPGRSHVTTLAFPYYLADGKPAEVPPEAAGTFPALTLSSCVSPKQRLIQGFSSPGLSLRSPGGFGASETRSLLRGVWSWSRKIVPLDP